MQWIQSLGERLEEIGPIHLELFLKKLLRSWDVLDPGEAVLLAEIAESFPVHTAAQPFPAIDAYVDVKGEPGLNC